MYDIDFCLSNYIDGKTKIGVTTNIRLAHNSVGELKDNYVKGLLSRKKQLLPEVIKAMGER